MLSDVSTAYELIEVADVSHSADFSACGHFDKFQFEKTVVWVVFVYRRLDMDVLSLMDESG